MLVNTISLNEYSSHELPGKPGDAGKDGGRGGKGGGKLGGNSVLIDIHEVYSKSVNEELLIKYAGVQVLMFVHLYLKRHRSVLIIFISSYLIIDRVLFKYSIQRPLFRFSKF
jgi:hypothetical protein